MATKRKRDEDQMENQRSHKEQNHIQQPVETLNEIQMQHERHEQMINNQRRSRGERQKRRQDRRDKSDASKSEGGKVSKIEGVTEDEGTSDKSNSGEVNEIVDNP